LRKSHSESESSLSDLETNFDETYEPAAGLFGEYFNEFGELKEEMLPFIDITESEELLYLNSLKKQEETNKNNKEINRNVVSSSSSFKNIPRRNRSFLKRHHQTTLLYKIDSLLFDFLSSESDMIEIENSCSYERLMIHSICKFYNLASHSINKKGKKKVVIKKRQKSKLEQHHLESLSTFLESIAHSESEETDEESSEEEDQDEQENELEFL